MVTDNRPTWGAYFLAIAKDVSTRATCPRGSVGVVIVKDRRILATGYNGSLSGEPHCADVGCILDENGRHCQRVVHAEMNAVAQAARFGISIDGATLYEWDSRGRKRQCDTCDKVARSAGIVAFVVSGPSQAEITTHLGVTAQWNL